MKPSSSATNLIPGDRNTDPADLLRTIQSPYWVPVSGSSMQPLLRNGDFVLIQPLNATNRSNLRPGHIILFVRDSQLIVHRFLGWDQDELLEHGDRQKEINRLQGNDLLGIAVQRKRNRKIRPLNLPLSWWLRGLIERGGSRK